MQENKQKLKQTNDFIRWASYVSQTLRNVLNPTGRCVKLGHKFMALFLLLLLCLCLAYTPQVSAGVICWLDQLKKQTCCVYWRYQLVRPHCAFSHLQAGKGLYPTGTKLYLLPFTSRKGFVPDGYKFAPPIYTQERVCTRRVQVCTSHLHTGSICTQPWDALIILIK